MSKVFNMYDFYIKLLVYNFEILMFITLTVR